MGIITPSMCAGRSSATPLREDAERCPHGKDANQRKIKREVARLKGGRYEYKCASCARRKIHSGRFMSTQRMGGRGERTIPC